MGVFSNIILHSLRQLLERSLEVNVYNGALWPLTFTLALLGKVLPRDSKIMEITFAGIKCLGPDSDSF